MMHESAQKKAVQNYRRRLTQRGLTRFEVQALAADRDLLRTLARRLVEEGPAAQQARAAVQRLLAGGPPMAGGILAALRRSPLVGDDLDLTRDREEGRLVDL